MYLWRYYSTSIQFMPKILYCVHKSESMTINIILSMLYTLRGCLMNEQQQQQQSDTWIMLIMQTHKTLNTFTCKIRNTTLIVGWQSVVKLLPKVLY